MQTTESAMARCMCIGYLCISEMQRNYRGVQLRFFADDRHVRSACFHYALALTWHGANISLWALGPNTKKWGFLKSHIGVKTAEVYHP